CYGWFLGGGGLGGPAAVRGARRGSARGLRPGGQVGGGAGRPGLGPRGAGGNGPAAHVQGAAVDPAVELRGLLVLTLDGFVQLFAVYCDSRRRGDAEADLVAPDIDDGDLDLVADHDRLVALT